MPIPVILDTDIGDDIDDTWALAMLLRCPELDLKLAVADTGNTEYRAKILARLLETAGRCDVDVGVGVVQDSVVGGQAAWVENYDLRRYPGRVHADGVDAIIRTVRQSAEPVTLICIGPMPNIRLALGRAPDLAGRTRFVGMHGSLRRHHDGGEGAIAEWNVICDFPACRRVFGAAWREAVITPLDTCGQVRLQGDLYRRVKDSRDPLLQAVIENYRIWLGPRCHEKSCDFENTSSILFDTVAVHLAYSTRFLRMERMGLRVDHRAHTVPDPKARPFDVAVDWTDLDGYRSELVRRLTGG